MCVGLSKNSLGVAVEFPDKTLPTKWAPVGDDGTSRCCGKIETAELLLADCDNITQRRFRCLEVNKGDVLQDILYETIFEISQIF